MIWAEYGITCDILNRKEIRDEQKAKRAVSSLHCRS